MNKDFAERVSGSGYKYALFGADNTSFFYAANALPNVSIGLGRYKGVTEHSFMSTAGFLSGLLQYGSHLDNQESVLMVSECNKMYAELIFADGRPNEALGSLHVVTRQEALQEESWTFMNGNYYVAKHGNPDRVPPPAGWPTTELRKELEELVHNLRVSTRPSTNVRRAAADIIENHFLGTKE